MGMFAALFPTLLNMTLLIGLGYLLGRLHKIDLNSVAALLIYGFSPIVVFGAVLQLNFTPALALLPIISFVLASVTGLSCLWLGHRLLPKNNLGVFLLPNATGAGNVGYFGLPVAMALLGEKNIGIYIFTILGVNMYEATLSYYFLARGRLTTTQAVRRVLRLPIIYAMIIGVGLSSLHVALPLPLLKFWEIAKGAYVCLGMMLLGLALANQKRLGWDLPLLGISLFGKFLLVPLLTLAVVLADQRYTMLLTPIMAQCLMVIAVVPSAANLNAYAVQNNMPVDKAASIVLVSSLCAIVGTPLLLQLLLNLAGMR
jgi:predicted permease